MKKLIVAVLAIAAPLLLGGCSNPDYDPDLCDLQQGLAAMSMQVHGYVEADIQEQVDKYCTR